VNFTPDMGDRVQLLLVDDCVAERDLYALTLTPEFKVITASRGDEGFEMARHERPQAIVLDVMMPGMDGWETCTRIKCDAITADIPVILLTGADDRDLTQHANAVGASALLQKPCPAERLRDVIVSVLDGTSISKR
jgi:CheY-like chemotaxis protein